MFNVLEGGEVLDVFANRIGRALIPASVVHCLFRGQNIDETVVELVEPIGLVDVLVERRRVELREDQDFIDLRVQTIADGNVN